MEKIRQIIKSKGEQSIAQKRAEDLSKKQLEDENKQKLCYKIDQIEFMPEFAPHLTVLDDMKNAGPITATHVLSVSDGFITVYNEKYVSKTQLSFLSPQVQEYFKVAEPTSLMYKPSTKATSEGIRLPSAPQLQFLWESIFDKLKLGGKLKFESNQDIGLWLPMLGMYESFMTSYVSYCLNPDSGVSTENLMIPEVGSGHVFDHLYKDRFISDPYKKNLEDFKAFVHLVILDMNRNLSQSENQLELTIKNRLNAFKYSIHYPLEIHLPVDFEFFMSLQGILDMYPKLRAVIWSTCNILNTSYPELPLAYQLTEYAGMIHIKLAYDFITMGERTLAHRDPIMWNEMTDFYSIYSTLLTTLGEQDVKYYRFLMPEDRRLVMSKFKNLYNAAHVYFAQTDETLKNITAKVKPTIRDLEYFAKTLDRDAAVYYTNLNLDATARGIVNENVKNFVVNQLRVKEDMVGQYPDYNAIRETEGFKNYKQDKANQLLSRPMRIGFRAVSNANVGVPGLSSLSDSAKEQMKQAMMSIFFGEK